MNIADIKTISLNPFFCGSLIPHFVQGSKNKRIKTELVYFLFPLVFEKISRDILINSKSTSTIYSAFLDNKAGRIALGGIEKRYASFKTLTNQSLIVAVNEGKIKFNSNLYANGRYSYTDENDSYIRDFYKASHYLGSILSKVNHLEVFVKLGIKEL